MGLKWDLSEDEAIINNIKQNMQAAREFSSDLGTRVQAVVDAIDSGELSDSAYNAAKQVFQELYLPITNAINLLVEGLGGDVSSYVGNRGNVESLGHYDEDNYQEALRELDAQLTMLNSIQIVAEIENAIFHNIDLLKYQRRQVVEKMNRMHDFDSATSSLFSSLESTLNSIEDGLKYINGGSVDCSGNFTAAAGTNRNWIDTLNDNSVKTIVGKVTRPKDMSDEQFKDYKNKLYKQAANFLNVGWAASSVRAYARYANKNSNKLFNGKYNSVDELTNHLWKKANQVGSMVFLDTWNADTINKNADDSKKHATKKLALLMDISGMSDVVANGGLNGSAEQTSELLKKFGNIAPDNKFWDSLAKTEQMALPKGLYRRKDDFSKALNQYRYVISAQQVKYVRDNYSENGKLNDENALVAYLSDGRKYSTEESARLHEKRNRDTSLDPDGKKGYNIKIVQNFHSEFILSDDGRLLTELDPNKDASENKNGVVNGSSYNYADENDYDSNKGVDWNKEHSQHYVQDIKVSTWEPEFRNEIIGTGDNKYKAPDDSKKYYEYSKYNSTYGTNGASSKDIVIERENDFKSKITETEFQGGFGF